MSETPLGETPPQPDADWTDKQLPPVKPPTAGLLMQLFFVPMIIVSIIVAVWLMFGWLAESGTRPAQLAANISKLNKGSWQDAHRLSNMLRDPRETELRQNKELITRLSGILVNLLEADAETEPEKRKLMIWLCRALGEFDIDNGLSTLIAATESDDLDVRRAAIQSIGVFADGFDADVSLRHPELLPRLEETAFEYGTQSEEEIPYGMVRSSTAFTLGIIGVEQSLNTLERMLADSHPDVRYNAACGLARNGDSRSIPRIKEMLQLDNEEALRFEQDEAGNIPESNKKWKQYVVIKNGLEAVTQLYEKQKLLTPDSELLQQLRELEASNELHGEVAIKLSETIRTLQ